MSRHWDDLSAWAGPARVGLPLYADAHLAVVEPTGKLVQAQLLADIVMVRQVDAVGHLLESRG
jgi:hypothetical protein